MSLQMLLRLQALGPRRHMDRSPITLHQLESCITTKRYAYRKHGHFSY
uniref:Actin-depolymerizing factor 6 n=1 Tax=Arundo donax TaxID=35708 RepID=A0A0A9G5K5_ARUDO